MKSSSVSLKLRSFFSSRRNVIIVISVVSFLILLLVGVFFWMVYTKDKPSFVPEETKGKIRKGIEDVVGENVKKVAPDLGQGIIDASFDNQVGNNRTLGLDVVTQNQLNPDTADPTAGWLVYIPEDMGISLKIPSDWGEWSKDDLTASFSARADVSYLKTLKDKYQNTDQVFWGGKSISLSDVTKSQGIGDINTYVARNFTGAGIKTEKVSINGNEAQYVVDASPDRFGGGTGYYYIFEKDGRVYELSLDYFSNQTVSQSYVNILKGMAESIN